MPLPLVGRDRSPIQDPVYQAVPDRFFGGHPSVAVGVEFDLLPGLAGVSGEYVEHLLFHPDDLAGMDLDVAGLPLDLSGDHRLVDQDPAVGEGGPLPLVRRRRG